MKINSHQNTCLDATLARTSGGNPSSEMSGCKLDLRGLTHLEADHEGDHFGGTSAQKCPCDNKRRIKGKRSMMRVY